MVLYQSGDYEAFTCLYGRHSGRVFQYLKTKTSPHVAPDLLQEVFLKIHRSREQYSSQYPFLPWLFTVARNTAIDFFKNSQTKLASASDSGELLLGRLVAEAENFENASKNDLAAVLISLPDAQKRAIELRYLSDWTFEKIAEEMKTSPENSRQLISRGLKKIRSLMKGGGNES